MLKLLALFLLASLVQARFYRNIPLARDTQRLVEIELPAEELLEGAVGPSNSAISSAEGASAANSAAVNGHLLALRPDYALMNVASVFRNFFGEQQRSRGAEPSRKRAGTGRANDIPRERSNSYLIQRLRKSLS